MMKAVFRFSISFFCMLLVTLGYSQKKEYGALEVSPQPIRAGKIVRLSLDALKTELGSVDDTVQAIMFVYKSGKVSSYDTVTRLANKKLTAIFRIPDSADAVAFKFMRGNAQAVNKGYGYFFPVQDKNGLEQIGTYNSLFTIHTSGHDAGISKTNPELARKYYNKWFAVQDLSKMTFYEKAIAFYLNSDTTAFCEHLNGIGSVSGLSEGQIMNLISAYSKGCNQATRDRLRRELESRFPDGSWKWKPWFDSIRVLKTIPEKFAWVKAFRMAYPEDEKKEFPKANDMFSSIMSAAVKPVDLQSLIEAAVPLEKDPRYQDRLISLYTLFLNQALFRDTLTSELLSMANRVVEYHLDRQFKAPLPGSGNSKYLFLHKWKKDYYDAASIYGTFLAKNGEYEKAAQLTEPAARYQEWKNSIYNERYFSVAEKVRPAAELLKDLKLAFLREGYTLTLKNVFFRLNEKLGLGDGRVALDNLLNAGRKKMQEKVKEKMKSIPAPEFILPNLKGGQISLASLKGKVILIDFWATWCGPCIASFPSMKQLVENNISRDDVAILFVNTWQKETDKYATVRKFFSDNPFPFEVYLDLQDEVVKRFNVAAIPTKIVIDRKGIIRFVSLGFVSEEEKGVEELQAMIDVASQM